MPTAQERPAAVSPIHRHQLVLVAPSALDDPTRLAQGPVGSRGNPATADSIPAVVVSVDPAADTLTVNTPGFALDTAVTLALAHVAEGRVVPQTATDGTPVWAW